MVHHPEQAQKFCSPCEQTGNTAKAAAAATSTLLGKWNTKPVDNELRDDSKPVNARYYPVPQIDKETF
jgi:hypothetical protein